MIGYRMPIFQDGNLLTKEMLEQLKNFTIRFGNLSLAGYADGIVSGGKIRGDRNLLTIAPCMIKYGDHVVWLPEAANVVLQSTQKMQVVKLVLSDVEKSDGFEQIQMEIRTETEEDDSKGIELCRVRMQEGARLRSVYTDFFDMNTKYDTLILIHSCWSAYEKASLHPEILQFFFEQARELQGKEPIDLAFLMQIGNLQGRTCERKLLDLYLNEKLGEQKQSRTNEEIYNGLCQALREMKKIRHKTTERRMERRMIVE